jgi:hypothetical protein
VCKPAGRPPALGRPGSNNREPKRAQRQTTMRAAITAHCRRAFTRYEIQEGFLSVDGDDDVRCVEKGKCRLPWR